MNGSRIASMKELRVRSQVGVWRIAFAFDLFRKAVILVVGDKRGIASARFCKALIATADKRFKTTWTAWSRKGSSWTI